MNNRIAFRKIEPRGLYGGYMFADEAEIEEAKKVLLDQIIGQILEAAKDDWFWIVKHVDPNDPLSVSGCPVEIRDHAVTVGWKVHFPQMEPEKDYKGRMKDEYWQVKHRYLKLHDMCIKYEAGTLDFTPTCSLELLTAQKAAMGKYLHCLEVRAQIEGIKL